MISNGMPSLRAHPSEHGAMPRSPAAKCAPIFSTRPVWAEWLRFTDPRSGEKHIAATLFYRNFTNMI